jgi:hypothetical protein
MTMLELVIEMNSARLEAESTHSITIRFEDALEHLDKCGTDSETDGYRCGFNFRQRYYTTNKDEVCIYLAFDLNISGRQSSHLFAEVPLSEFNNDVGATFHAALLRLRESIKQHKKDLRYLASLLDVKA